MEKSKGIGSIEESNKVNKYGNSYFLGIGIDTYKFCPILNNAVKDVKDFLDVISSKYGFDTAIVKTLFNEEATSENILIELKKIVKNVQPIDNVLIYFSGHGDLDDVLNTGYWIPYEAELNKVNQYFHNSVVHTILNKINSRHTFLIVDSVFRDHYF